MSLLNTEANRTSSDQIGSPANFEVRSADNVDVPDSMETNLDLARTTIANVGSPTRAFNHAPQLHPSLAESFQETASDARLTLQFVLDDHTSLAHDHLSSRPIQELTDHLSVSQSESSA